jgi:hypothetical protein
VTIELDRKQVVDDISNKIGIDSELETILNYCKASLSRLPNFKISFIKQEVNNMIHLLVKTSLLFASSQHHDHITSYI